MAKRKDGGVEVGTGTSTRAVIEDFAEDLGRMLGTARSKAEDWLGQRQSILKQLTQLRDEATALLSQLGHEAAIAGQRGRRAASEMVASIQKRGPGRPAGSKNRAGIIIVGGKKRRRRKMSAKARAAISAAQKARWAKQKAGEKK